MSKTLEALIEDTKRFSYENLKLYKTEDLYVLTYKLDYYWLFRKDNNKYHYLGSDKIQLYIDDNITINFSPDKIGRLAVLDLRGAELTHNDDLEFLWETLKRENLLTMRPLKTYKEYNYQYQSRVLRVEVGKNFTIFKILKEVI